jgi:hypothetical protein
MTTMPRRRQGRDRRLWWLTSGHRNHRFRLEEHVTSDFESQNIFCLAQIHQSILATIVFSNSVWNVLKYKILPFKWANCLIVFEEKNTILTFPKCIRSFHQSNENKLCEKTALKFLIVHGLWCGQFSCYSATSMYSSTDYNVNCWLTYITCYPYPSAALTYLI